MIHVSNMNIFVLFITKSCLPQAVFFSNFPTKKIMYAGFNTLDFKKFLFFCHNYFEINSNIITARAIHVLFRLLINSQLTKIVPFSNSLIRSAAKDKI